MTSVVAAPLAEFTVRAGVFFQILVLRLVHVPIISLKIRIAQIMSVDFSLETNGTLLYFNEIKTIAYG